jgi:hypothetical protein
MPRRVATVIYHKNPAVYHEYLAVAALPPLPLDFLLFTKFPPPENPSPCRQKFLLKFAVLFSQTTTGPRLSFFIFRESGKGSPD